MLLAKEDDMLLAKEDMLLAKEDDMLLAKEDYVCSKRKGPGTEKASERKRAQRQKNKQRVVEPTAQGFGARDFKAESVKSRSERA